MRAGIMRNAADIQNALTIRADTGEDIYSYKTVTGGRNVKISATNLTQRKTEDGYIQGSGEEKWEVRMRFRADVGYNTRIKLWTGTNASTDFLYLRVNAIEDIGNKHKDLRLGCERMYV